FYSILLPLYIDNNEGRLVTLYSLELAGAAGGVLGLIGVGSPGLTALYVPYSIFFLAGLVLFRFGLALAIFLGVMGRRVVVCAARARWAEQRILVRASIRVIGPGNGLFRLQPLPEGRYYRRWDRHPLSIPQWAGGIRLFLMGAPERRAG